MPNKSSALQLIRTKLNRPRVSSSVVPRTSLCARLNLAAASPLILVSAPAGYGKSTLISTWLDRWDGANAWLTLDELDSDLFSFLTYFLAAIHTIFLQACDETFGLLKATTLPPLLTLATNLLNDLNDIDQNFVFVLDDFHTIHDPDIHALLGMLLNHPPHSMHLVLISRRDPPLPLSLLRAKGLMGEIRTQDLRFSVDEVGALVQQMEATKLDSTIIAALEKETEGWVVGLLLAIRSRRNRGHANGLPTKIQGSNAYILDFLTAEVLGDLPPEAEAFLVKTSILNRMCGSLCAAVIGIDSSENDAQAYLVSAVDGNLFVSALDNKYEWFRSHHLFRQVLQHRLQSQGADKIANLHIRASDWFARNGFIEEAIQHALDAGDMSKAVRLVSEQRHALMNQDQWQRLDRWLQLFPSDVIETEPDLLIARAWLLQVRWRLTELQSVLDRLDVLLDRAANANAMLSFHQQAELHTLRSIPLGISVAIEPALAHLQQAIAMYPPESYYARGYTMIQMGCIFQVEGNVDAAVTLASGGLQEIPGNTMFRTRMLIMLSLVYWMSGDLENLWQVASRCLAISQREDIALGLSWANYFQGCVHYHRNDLAAAERAFAWVVERPFFGHGIALRHSACGLALTYQAQGQPDRACEVVRSIKALMLESHNTIGPEIQAFHVELALRQGRVAEASQWVSRNDYVFRPQALVGFYGSQLALPKILIAQDTAISLQQAADYLSALHDFLESTHNTRFLIEAKALTSLLHRAQGDQSAALASLAQAVSLAEPYGFIRLFVDLGLKLQSLFVALADTGVAPSLYIAQILRAYDRPSPHDHDVSMADGSQSRPPQPDQALSDFLTNREIDVLLFLADRLTNKEIAQKLGISAQTVKQHAANLYQKLHVHNRRQAVAKARALGILNAQ